MLIEMHFRKAYHCLFLISLYEFKIFRRFTKFCTFVAIDFFKIRKTIQLAKPFFVEFG